MMKSAKGFRAVAFLLATVALLPTQGMAQSPSTAKTVPPARPTPAPEVTPPSDFTIGPEDVLGLVFWREPDMSGDVTVRPDGRITIPMVGEIQASGRTPVQLTSEVQKAASKFIVGDVNVVVVVRQINSRKVFVLGRVTSAKSYPIIGPLNVLQAIALAGGLTDYADPKHITIIRKENGKDRIFNFNYQDVSRGKNLQQNIELRPGDQVVVP
jgi:polysaccharide export outer membrane protein